MHAKKFAELKAMSLEELISQYDRDTPHVVLGLNFIREEIARREAEAQTERMLNLTRHVRDMTVTITVMTLVVVVMTAVNIYLAS